jgi:RHS repeat-associated protein
MGMDIVTAKACRGWKPLLAGMLVGLLAAGSASSHTDAAASSLRAVSATNTQTLPLHGAERLIRLPSGQQLVLSSNGTVLSLRDTAQRVLRSYRLPQPRINASLTLLPNGRVLIWGGADSQGRLPRGGLWFDPQLQALESVNDLTLSPRAGHTATVLTDGRVLFAGGRPSQLAAELWDERDNRAIALADQTAIDRAGQSARLQADGRVRLSGGVDARNRANRADFVFDTSSGRFTAEAQVVYPRAEPAAGLAASLPTHGADDVMPDARLSVRFTQRMRIADLAPSHVTLIGPGGVVPVRVVPVEDGRLVFVQPEQTLFPDSKYTLMIDGANTAAGMRASLITVDFKTAAFDMHGRKVRTQIAAETKESSAAKVVTGDETASTGCPQTQKYYTPCRARGQLNDGIWSPGQDNTDSRWRIYGPSLEVEKSPRIARIASIFHVTMVRGRVVRVDQKPVADVEVSIGEEIARTDANGWFTLFGVPAGYRELYVDGTTANRGEEEYGQFVVGVQVKGGQLNELPYLMHLPRISQRDKIRIPSPLQQDMVVGHPDIPGLELHIPKGTVIYDRKGRLVTELAIVPTPVNRAPFPVMENHPMAFTVEPGAAQIRGLSPTAHNGIRVYYPNYDRYTAGTEANFWIYDPREGWRVYGKGTVSPDGKHIVPERGVALHQTMGGMYSVPGTNGPTEPGLAPDNSGQCGCSGGAATAGDPIDLKTGEFTHAETDIAITDVVPITITRNYRPHDLKRREFGVGTSWNWGYTLNRPDTNTYDILDLVLPNGSSIRFDRISGSGNQGEWRQAGSNTKFSGASLKTVYDSDPTQPWGRAFLMTMRDGSRMQFSSYNDIRIRWIEDRFRNRTSLVYNSGLVTKIVSPSGRSLSIDYDTYNRIEAIRDHTGREWAYAYDGNGLLKDVIYPDTTAKHYAYQSRLQDGALTYHRIESIFDQKNHRVLLNEFEVVNDVATGRVVKQTQADNGVIEINYAHVDNGVAGTLVTEPDGSKRRIVFEANSPYPKSEIFGYGTAKAQTYSYERNAFGQIAAVVDPLGRRTEYSYNADGQVARVNALAGTPRSRAVDMDYNEEGDLVAVTDQLNRVIVLKYENRCLVGVVDAMNRSLTIKCDAAGQPVSITDAMSRTTILTYDGHDLISVTNPQGRSVKLRHDTLGRLISMEDSEGNVSRREYDLAGRVNKSVDAKGNSTEFGYDDNGNLEAVLLSNGSGFTYVYDDRNRLSTRTDALGQLEKWTYDKADRVKTYQDRKGQVTQFDYDVLGRLELTTYQDGSAVSSTYDTGNRLRTLADTAASGVLGWDYNDFDEVILATGPSGSVAYDYDAVGRRKEMTAASQPKVTYTYDDADRVRLITQGAESVTFEYDDADRLKKLVLPNGVKAGYAYNGADQITGIAWLKEDDTPLGDIGYGYGASGRLVAQTGTFSSQILPSASSTTNSFDDNNRQTQHEGQAITHDNNGNLTGAGARTYVWNARNQLAAIQEGASTIATFNYDALGRRSAKTENGQETTYLYDGIDTVQEVRAGSVNPILTGLGTDQRFARNDNGGRVYYLADQLGSTRALTDQQGSVLQRYDYTPYGETSQTSSAYTNPYRYTGREQDENGLYYYRARYYQPGLARFIAEDPLGFLGGDTNFYAYVQGKPLSMRDPSGLWAGIDDLIFAGGGALVGLVGQGISDVISGEVSGWEKYTAAAIGGALGGETLLYTGNPLLAGAVGGASTNAIGQGLEIATGKRACFNWTTFVVDSGVGTLTGLIPGAGKIIPGFGGRNGLSAVTKSTLTKLRNGTIQNVKGKTVAKMLGTNIIDNFPGAGAGGVAAAPSGKYLDDPSACGCN